MPSCAIRVEGLSKRYRIGARNAARTTLVDTLAEAFAAPIRKAASVLRGRAPESDDDEVWALRDVSFEVAPGEVVGVIGRNGAGKSTLLKVLSRITEPTAGFVGIHGRVGSLLEVGTGFHPELTGRDNVYLNGAILGMKRLEIDRKFDQIVAFAEIERFLDTPVKHYSTGMYMRLAFAVAAHLDPEILLVDEVLAVGDAGFQRKCLGKMSDVAREGRTVLFVSHNMPAVENLCSRVCVIHQGNMIFDGDTSEGIGSYHARMLEEVARAPLAERQDRTGSGVMKIVAFSIMDEEDRPASVLLTGRGYRFCFHFVSRAENVARIDFGFTVFDSAHHAIFRNRTVESGLAIPESFPVEGELVCRIPRLPLTAGRYSFGFRLLVNGLEADYIVGAYAAYFDVVEGDYFGTGKVSSHASMLIDHSWEVVTRHRGPH